MNELELAAEEAALKKRGLLDQVQDVGSRVARSGAGQKVGGLLEFMADTGASMISPAYKENLIARNKMGREEELRQRGQAFSDDLYGAPAQEQQYDSITRELFEQDNPGQELPLIQTPGTGLSGGEFTIRDYLQRQQSNPNKATAIAASQMMRDQMEPVAQANKYSNIVRGAQGNAFGIDNQGRQVRLPGDAVPQKEQHALVENHINTRDSLDSLADKETYKITGKFRGDRLNKVDGTISTARDVASSISETRLLLNDLYKKTGNKSTGFGSYLAKIPAFQAKDWYEAKEVIISRLAVDKMKELKAMSPTGSTGFGALSERELETLQKQLGSLEQSLDPEDIQRNIAQIMRLLQKSESKFNRVVADEVKWFNRNKLPGTEALDINNYGPSANSRTTPEEDTREYGGTVPDKDGYIYRIGPDGSQQRKKVGG